MIKILVGVNRAEVGKQVHSMDHQLCGKCHDPNCKFFDIKYREPNMWMYNPSMLRSCVINESLADFPDVEPYLLDASGSPKKVVVDITYKDPNQSKNSITYNFDLRPNAKISHYVHSAFNYEEGDIYGWPMDNMEPEDVDKWYHNGQRTFVFLGSHRGEQVVNVYVVDTEYFEENQRAIWDEHQKNERNKKKAELLDDLLECDYNSCSMSGEDYITELDVIRSEIKKLK